MFTVDLTQVRLLENRLAKISRVALPLATKNTLNTAAFKARALTQKKIREKLITRNKWTERSIQVRKTTTLKMKDQESVVGSRMDYMEDQEFGGGKIKKGKEGMAIPTSVASGEGEGVAPRRRLVRRAKKMKNIKLRRHDIEAKNKAHFIFLAVLFTARQSGKRFVYLPLRRHPGIYQVMGRKKNPKIKLLHDFSKTSVRIPKTPTLGPATERVTKNMNRIFIREANRQFKRAKLK